MLSTLVLLSTLFLNIGTAQNSPDLSDEEFWLLVYSYDRARQRYGGTALEGALGGLINGVRTGTVVGAIGGSFAGALSNIAKKVVFGKDVKEEDKNDVRIFMRDMLGLTKFRSTDQGAIQSWEKDNMFLNKKFPKHDLDPEAEKSIKDWLEIERTARTIDVDRQTAEYFRERNRLESLPEHQPIKPYQPQGHNFSPSIDPHSSQSWGNGGDSDRRKTVSFR